MRIPFSLHGGMSTSFKYIVKIANLKVNNTYYKRVCQYFYTIIYNNNKKLIGLRR